MDIKYSQYTMINQNYWSNIKVLPKDISEDLKLDKIDFSKSKIIDKKVIIQSFNEYLEIINQSKD